MLEINVTGHLAEGVQLGHQVLPELLGSWEKKEEKKTKSKIDMPQPSDRNARSTDPRNVVSLLPRKFPRVSLTTINRERRSEMRLYELLEALGEAEPRLCDRIHPFRYLDSRRPSGISPLEQPGAGAPPRRGGASRVSSTAVSLLRPSDGTICPGGGRHRYGLPSLAKAERRSEGILERVPPGRHLCY